MVAARTRQPEGSFSPTRILHEQVRLRPGKTAITDPRRSVTFAELDQASSRVATALRGHGIGPGDRVVFVGRNSVDFFELLFATAKTGAVLAPLNWRLPNDQLGELIAEAGARVVVADAEFAVGSPAGSRLIGTGEEFARWRDQHDPTTSIHGSTPEDVIVQSYTSGTTGLPKGALLTNRSFGHLVRLAEHYGIDSASVMALPLPVFHVGGNGVGFIGLSQGASLVAVPAFDADDLLDLVERERVTWMPVAATVLTMLVSAQRSRPRDLSTWQKTGAGGQPISPELFTAVRDILGIELTQSYGMTESASAVTHLDASESTGPRRSSVGRALPWVEIACADPVSGDPQPPGQSGEVCLRSQQCATGYWNRPEATAHLQAPGGWIRTGDVGYLDEDGYLYLNGRIDDMIKTGGENVHPAEVEAVLVEHPAVAEAAVVGLPDDRWGQQVTAYVIATDPALTAPDLLEWAKPRMAGFQRPKAVHFVDRLPRSPEGKLLRRQLATTRGRTT